MYTSYVYVQEGYLYHLGDQKFHCTMEQTIRQCQTLDDLEWIERQYILDHRERALLFEQRCDIIERLLRWGRENEELGLSPSLSDNWTPEQREQFLADWQDDAYLAEATSQDPVLDEENDASLIDWLNQQSTIDWINQYQEEMQGFLATSPKSTVFCCVNSNRFFV